MSDGRMKAVRFSVDELAIVEAAQRKLGVRSASEVVRMGLHALAREQVLVIAAQGPKARRSCSSSSVVRNELDDLK